MYVCLWIVISILPVVKCMKWQTIDTSVLDKYTNYTYVLNPMLPSKLDVTCDFHKYSLLTKPFPDSLSPCSLRNHGRYIFVIDFR